MDALLIQRFRGGQSSALSFVIQHYSGHIFTYFLLKTKISEIAEELTSDTFNRLWKYRLEIDPEQGIEPYLRQIAHGIFQNWLKKFEREKQRMAEYVEDYLHQVEVKSLDDSLNTQMDLTLLIEKLTKLLPEKCCQVFLLSRLHGWTYEEIAQELCISKDTVKFHLVKAKKVLSEIQHLEDLY